MMSLCKTCNTKLTGKYCHSCGEEADLKRIDRNYATEEFVNFIYLEKKFLQTIKKILTQPGKSVREYLAGSRNTMTKPLPFIILTGAMFMLINRYFHFESMQQDDEVSKILPIINWSVKNYGYFHIFLGIVNAFWVKLLFRKTPYNIFELMVLLFYTMGVSILLDLVLGLIDKVLPIPIVGFLVGFFYLSWAIGSFFGGQWRNYVKAGLAHILGMVSLMLIVLLSSLIYLILK